MKGLNIDPRKTISAGRPSIRWSPLPRGLLFAWLSSGCFALWCQADAQQLNPIQQENQKRGTTAWQLTNAADNRQIEGYASLTSVPVGGDIQLFVNTQDATYSLTIYRMGWYGGTGGRNVLGPQTLTGVQQIIPTVDPTKELVECNWTNPFRIHVPTSWVSGIYLAKLHGNTSGKESYITFTVRDTRNADIVFQQSVTTYQAYNGWLGQSLYMFNTKDMVQVDRVSFNRPYAAGNPAQGAGAGDFLGTIAPVAIEYSLLRWLEHHGFDVTYITNVDTHEDVGRLLRGKGFLSVGHDEYWSHDMKAHIIQARDSGVGLGFFSANYAFWPIDLQPSSSGAPNRTISVALDNRCVDRSTRQPSTTVCSRDSDCAAGQACSIKNCNFTCLVDSNAVSQTEQALVGGMWDPGHLIDPKYGGDIVVTSDALLNHWVFANTGLQVGDVLPGLIGVEWDSTRNDYPKPAGLEVLLHTQVPHFQWPNGSGGFAMGPGFDGKDFDGWYQSFVNSGRQQDLVCHHDKIGPYGIAPTGEFCSNPWPDWPDHRYDWGMTIYQASSGAWVFNAATMEWGWGLDDYFTGLTTADGANNGPPVRTQCGYPWFHPGLVSCRNSAIDQITRNVLNKFIGPPCLPPIVFTVNTTADGDDANPGDGICETAPGNGVCTLRAAIEEAQRGTVAGCNHPINFSIPTTDPGYNGTSWTITVATVLPDLYTNIEIDGPGRDKLIVQPTPGGAFRVFNVTATGTVTFFELTIANGSSAVGGGIQNLNTGTVNVTNCTLRNNIASGDGGGIYNNSTGTVNITNSALSNNGASGPSRRSGRSGRGGGIFNNSSGTVSVTNSTLSSNAASGGYGVNPGVGGPGQGGGIFNAGNGAVVNVTNSTLSGNSANGGFGFSSGLGGAAQGGGIFNSSGTVNVTNSTVSGNSANGGNSCGTSGCGGSGAGQGGGIFNASNDAVVNVANSTLTSNTATDGNDSSHPNGGPGHGGGVFSSAGIVTVESAIIAGNSSTTSDADGNFTSNGFNLIGKNDGAASSFPAGNPNTNNDIVGTGGSPIDPKLDPKGLQNNGGPTQTIALLPSSPAIDKGTSKTLDTTLTVDQRGVGYARTVQEGLPKPLGGDGTDIGAFEFGAQIIAASQKTHAANPDPTKTFGIPLPLTGTPGIECRRNTGADTIGPNVGRDHEVVITFARPVTVGGGVSVSSNNSSDTPTATLGVNSNIVTVDLHNIPNPRRLTITLASVSDGTNTNDVSIPMGVLLGDVNANGLVDGNDVSAVQGQTRQPVSTTNFREDVNANGIIDGNDVSLTQGQTRTSLP